MTHQIVASLTDDSLEVSFTIVSVFTQIENKAKFREVETYNLPIISNITFFLKHLFLRFPFLVLFDSVYLLDIYDLAAEKIIPWFVGIVLLLNLISLSFVLLYILLSI